MKLKVISAKSSKNIRMIVLTTTQKDDISDEIKEFCGDRKCLIQVSEEMKELFKVVGNTTLKCFLAVEEI